MNESEYLGREEEPLTDEEQMQVYEMHTKKQIRELSDEEFSKEFHSELASYGLDADVLNEFLYNERNNVINLIQEFRGGRLRFFSLEELIEKINDLVFGSERVKKINDTYSELKGQSNYFYEQYQKLLDPSVEILSDEIEKRHMSGDHR